MLFGVCTDSAHAQTAQAGGWDFIEGNVQSLFRGQEFDWTEPPGIALPMPAANSMVPGSLKITGPTVDAAALDQYMGRVLARAQQIGMHTIVFGSGDARKVPDGFERIKAVEQIVAFLTRIAPVARKHGVTIVIEPLNRGETNIINTVSEAMTYVRRINDPAIQCLVDSYHFWLENEPLTNLETAMPWIRHVHVADKDDRVAPGESGRSDYVPFFKVLKAGGYDKLISVECRGFDFATNGPRSLDRLQDDWAKA